MPTFFIWWDLADVTASQHPLSEPTFHVLYSGPRHFVPPEVSSLRSHRQVPPSAPNESNPNQGVWVAFLSAKSVYTLLDTKNKDLTSNN